MILWLYAAMILWNSGLVCCILILICICLEQKKSLPNIVAYSKGVWRGIKKMWILKYWELLMFSFWMLDWRDTATCPRDFILLSDTLFQGNTKLLDMQWPVYSQIIWCYFQSHDHGFATFPLIPSDSENCFARSMPLSIHKSKQTERSYLPHYHHPLSVSAPEVNSAMRFKQLNVSNACKLLTCTASYSSFGSFAESHPFLWNYDFTLLMWQTVMVWGCREGVCSFCICSSQIL